MTTKVPSKVLINGGIRLYQDKAPYIRAGKSILGAIEYDEAEDKLRCHVCGEWQAHLANHLKTHKMTARQYKRKYGLRRRTALVNEATRILITANAKKRNFAAVRRDPAFARKQVKAVRQNKFGARERATAELLNLRGRCKAQLLKKLQNVALAVGHTPSKAELKEYGLSWQSLVHNFGSLAKAAELAKLAPNKRSPGQRELYTVPQLIALLQNFRHMNGRFPTASDMRRHIGGLPSQSAFIRRFGTLRNAMRRAA